MDHYDIFAQELERLIGLKDGAPECLRAFFGATAFAGEDGPPDEDKVLANADAALAAWAFNNHSAEGLDGLLRLQGRNAYVMFMGEKWIMEKADPRFEGVLIFAGNRSVDD